MASPEADVSSGNRGLGNTTTLDSTAATAISVDALEAFAKTGDLEYTASEGDIAATIGNITAPPSRARNRRRKQLGATWDGRVAGMSLQEYRERKWSVDACYAKLERRGPSYSCRRPCLKKSQSSSGPILPIDVFKSFDAAKGRSASYSMGRISIATEPDRTPGPQHYNPTGIIGTGSHPTIPKTRGFQFGRERLLVNDDPSPAPGDYSLEGFEKLGRYKRMPKLPIQGREAWRESATQLPGPEQGEYKFDNATRYGKDTPIRWKMQGRTEGSEPPTSMAHRQLRKRVEKVQKSTKFEVPINYDKISPVLLALDSCSLAALFEALQNNASMIKDPNAFLISTAMTRLGNGAGLGTRSFVTPGPQEYQNGDGNFKFDLKQRSPKWRFGSEHRGLD
mmetsp:Transcript_53476/g.106447  ORF Transcript_53476/g.106447 Transcript_53476/m.106447 type:complete len:394 (+) Transcript_53476:77-1258(+)